MGIAISDCQRLGGWKESDQFVLSPGSLSMNGNCKLGLFSIGLAAYWPQFAGLRERLAGYGRFVAARLTELGAETIDVGMVDGQPSAAAAGERFVREDVDVVFCYVTTYATSSQVVPAV